MAARRQTKDKKKEKRSRFSFFSDMDPVKKLTCKVRAHLQKLGE